MRVCRWYRSDNYNSSWLTDDWVRVGFEGGASFNSWPGVRGSSRRRGPSELAINCSTRCSPNCTKHSAGIRGGKYQSLQRSHKGYSIPLVSWIGLQWGAIFVLSTLHSPTHTDSKHLSLFTCKRNISFVCMYVCVCSLPADSSTAHCVCVEEGGGEGAVEGGMRTEFPVRVGRGESVRLEKKYFA